MHSKRLFKPTSFLEKQATPPSRAFVVAWGWHTLHHVLRGAKREVLCLGFTRPGSLQQALMVLETNNWQAVGATPVVTSLMRPSTGVSASIFWHWTCVHQGQRGKNEKKAVYTQDKTPSSVRDCSVAQTSFSSAPKAPVHSSSVSGELSLGKGCAHPVIAEEKFALMQGVHIFYTPSGLWPKNPLCPGYRDLRTHAMNDPQANSTQGVFFVTTPLQPVSLEALDPRKGMVVILDYVTDPHNVGSLWRSAAALGAQAMILTKHNSPEVEGVLMKSASGATEHVPYVRVTNMVNTLEMLKKKGFFVVGLWENAPHVLAPITHAACALVIGSEGQGLRHLTRQHCDLLMRIPCGEDFSVLNASVAGAIAMYALGDSAR